MALAVLAVPPLAALGADGGTPAVLIYIYIYISLQVQGQQCLCKFRDRNACLRLRTTRCGSVVSQSTCSEFNVDDRPKLDGEWLGVVYADKVCNGLCSSSWVCRVFEVGNS